MWLAGSETRPIGHQPESFAPRLSPLATEFLTLYKWSKHYPLLEWSIHCEEPSIIYIYKRVYRQQMFNQVVLKLVDKWFTANCKMDDFFFTWVIFYGLNISTCLLILSELLIKHARSNEIFYIRQVLIINSLYYKILYRLNWLYQSPNCYILYKATIFCHTLSCTNPDQSALQ